MKNWTDPIIHWNQLPGTEVKRLIATWGMTPEQIAKYDPLMCKVQRQARDAHTMRKTCKRPFIKGDGGQARQRDLQRVVMKQGDAQQSRREQNEIDGYAEHRRATCS